MSVNPMRCATRACWLMSGRVSTADCAPRCVLAHARATQVVSAAVNLFMAGVPRLSMSITVGETWHHEKSQTRAARWYHSAMARRTAGAFPLLVTLDANADEALTEQLYESVRKLILS